jgi:hypothetical protein
MQSSRHSSCLIALPVSEGRAGLGQDAQAISENFSASAASLGDMSNLALVLGGPLMSQCFLRKGTNCC